MWVEDLSAACGRRRSLLLEGVSVEHELFPLFSSLTPPLCPSIVHPPVTLWDSASSNILPLARLSTRPHSSLSAADPLARNPCLSASSPLPPNSPARPIPPTTGRASSVLPTNFFGQVEHFHPSIHPLSLPLSLRSSELSRNRTQPPVPCSVNTTPPSTPRLTSPPHPLARSLAMSSSCSTGGGPSYCGRPAPGTWDLTDELNAFERKDRRAHGIDEKASMIMKGRKESRQERKERVKTEEEMFDTDA